MALDEYEDVDELEGRLRRNLESIVADMITVFRADLPNFVAREVRNRFVAHEAFAETIDDDTLRAIKVECQQVGDEVAEQVAEGLSGDMDFWFGPHVIGDEGKSFEEHAGLMERLQAASEATAELLERHNFPEDDGGGYTIRYAPPAYFVNGKYAPGLAESFWKYLGQLNEVREARRQQDLGRRRAVQRHRWDTVDQRKKPRGD